MEESKLDHFFVLVAIVAIVVSLYLLTNDKSYVLDSRKKEIISIGQVSSTDENIKRKSLTDNLWENLIKGDWIYNGDDIYCGPHSVLKIKLNDGNSLDLRENTHISLHQRERALDIYLHQGSFLAQIKTKIYVRVSSDRTQTAFTGPDNISLVEYKAPGYLEVTSQKNVTPTPTPPTQVISPVPTGALTQTTLTSPPPVTSNTTPLPINNKQLSQQTQPTPTSIQKNPPKSP